MISSPSTQNVASAEAARSHLTVLESERALASLVGLDADEAYMGDLRSEIEEFRSAFVGLAVTEIATLRGELFGRNLG